MLYQHMPVYRPLHRYGHFNVSRCSTKLYGINSYKQHSRLFSTLTDTTPSHLFFFSDAQNWAWWKIYLDICVLVIVWSNFLFCSAFFGPNYYHFQRARPN